MTSVVDQPYVGLVPFSEDDAQYFCGRADERRLIAANLLVARLTLLYGPSGVGKSSLLRAGVKPDLERETQRVVAGKRLPRAVVVLFDEWARPDPIGALTGALNKAVREQLQVEPPANAVEGALPELIGAWEAYLQDVIADPDGAPPPQLLVVLDQFEEYFHYHGHEDGAGTFATEFPRAIRDTRLRASFLVSIREDAYASLDRFEGRIPELFSNYLRLDYLDRIAAEAAIREPLSKYNSRFANGDGVQIEDELVDAVLDDVRKVEFDVRDAGREQEADVSRPEDRIETAYLQLVMRRLWNREERKSSKVLDLDTYHRLGGAKRIIEAHLDETMKMLKPEAQDLAAAAFDHLVTPSGAKIAHSAHDLAYYVTRELEGEGEVSPRKRQAVQRRLEPVLKRLAEQRVLRTIEPGPGAMEKTYEVYHDVLARSVLDWRAAYLQEIAERERFKLEQSLLHRPERVSFPELVQARFEMEVELRRRGRTSIEAEARFRVLLAVFEAAEGPIVSAYWGTKEAAAVAVTEKLPDLKARLLGAQPSYLLRRLTSSIVREDPQVAALLYRCDLLAVKAYELPPTAARNALESIAAVAGQLIALAERELSPDERNVVLLTQEVALDQIDARSRREVEHVARLSSWWGQSLLGVFLMALGAALLYSLVELWPAVQATASGSTASGADRTISLFGWSYHLSADAALLILVILASALGSYLHAIISFADYVGNKQLAHSWVWWYLLRVLVGGSLAVLVYFAIRGGLLATGSHSEDINVYGMAAISGFLGLCSLQATDKLREILDATFRVAPRYSARADQVSAPVLAASEPAGLQAGELTIALVGSGFVTGSVVLVARGGGPDLARKTVFHGPQRLEVTLEADDVAAPGMLLVTVLNPPPSGGASRSLSVPVDPTHAATTSADDPHRG